MASSKSTSKVTTATPLTGVPRRSARPTPSPTPSATAPTQPRRPLTSKSSALSTGGAPQGSEGSERPAHEDEASVLLDDGSFVLSFAYDGGGGDVPASGMDAPPAAAVPLMDLGHALPLQDDLALPPDVHAEAL